MNDELLLSIKKHTDTLTEQTKTKLQETFQFKVSKQMQTFSFNPPINLVEEGKWLLAVTSLDCTNSVFNITVENNSFSISTPARWNSEDSEELINKLNKLLELKSENDIDLHVKGVEKRGTRIEIENSSYTLAGFDLFKSELLSEIKGVKNRDLEDMVYRLQFTYDEIVDILDVKNIAGSTKGYTLPPGIYEINDINLMLKSLLPEEVKVAITIDDIRLKSNLTTSKTIRFTEKSFFLILCFMESNSPVVGDIPGFVQLIPGSYKSNKPVNILRIDKVPLTCDCFDGSVLDGV